MGEPAVSANIASSRGVSAAIARAAQRTGEDFDFLLAQARIESSLDPNARAAGSSAAGLFQFTNATWLNTLERHGAKHGYDWASAAISNGRIVEPALAGQIMQLRYDPAASALMAGELVGDNRVDLARALGRQPDRAELYLGHFLGSGDASRFIAALGENPDAMATALFPRASAANPGIFLNGSGEARSLREVMDVISGKIDGAARSYDGDRMTTMGGGWSASAVGRAAPATDALAGGRSMTDSLQSMFGGVGRDGSTDAPPAVRAAYARFERFGL